MTGHRRPPSRLPVRGVLGLALTGAGLALLLSFRTPALPGTDLAMGAPERVRATDGLLPTSQSGGPAARSLTGAAIETRWGPVQVRVTLEGGRVVGVDALQLPDGDGRSRRISERTEPVLRARAIERGSAQVDVVSGATYTSLGYAYSLQSALDQLGA